MLLQFNVKNFMSIKNEIVFTAFANADNTHEENLIPCGKDRILPSLAFYGAIRIVCWLAMAVSPQCCWAECGRRL